MRRFLATLILLVGFCLPARADRATEGGPRYTDGTEVQCDLPLPQWIKNVGGRDGAGLCVFTSIEHSGRWQNDVDLVGFQQKMRSEAGGGYPSKVDRMMAKYAPSVKYIQYSGNDPAILDLCMKTGRMPATTYGYSERYGGRISHMVNLVHLDDKIACVLDNNFIGADRLEWMSRGEFLRRWTLGGGGWTVILLSAPPPPVPVNVAPAQQLVYGSWVPSGCGPVGPDASSQSAQQRSRVPIPTPNAMQNLPKVPEASANGPKVEWRFLPGDPNRAYLYKGGIQIGGWDRLEKRWMSYDASSNRWSDGYPPWFADPSSMERSGQFGQVFFGVDRTRMSPEESFSVNGQQSSYQGAQRAFGDDTLSDDSGKLRITMCGTKELCDRVMSDLKSHPAMASMSNKFLVQSYRPGTWPMEVFKRPPGEVFFLSISGPPNKKSQGIEYHSQVAYDGPDKLAESMNEAMRRAEPNYDPNKTPDLSKPKPPPTPAPGAPEDSTWLLVVAAILALLFGGKRNANPN